jgi:hypothetical protein
MRIRAACQYQPLGLLEAPHTRGKGVEIMDMKLEVVMVPVSDVDRAKGFHGSLKTTFDSASDLSQALQRAAAAHGKHEERTGQADPDWPDWYAEYMVREQAGEELPL